MLFANNAFPYPLVDDDTKGMFRNVENTSSLAMIGLVGHTLLEGSVTLKKKWDKIRIILQEKHEYLGPNFTYDTSRIKVKLRLSSNRSFIQYQRKSQIEETTSNGIWNILITKSFIFRTEWKRICNKFTLRSNRWAA